MILSTTIALLIVPLTLSIVRPMSIIGSIANTGEIEVKNAPRPVPERETDAAIVAVPGTPAIPTEPIAMTITLMMYIVTSKGTPAILAMYTTHKPGNTPAQPCIPAVVPKLPTVLAVVALTPNLVVKVSTVNGNTPILERDVKAKTNGAFAFLKYVIGFTPNTVSKIACTTNITMIPT